MAGTLNESAAAIHFNNYFPSLMSMSVLTRAARRKAGLSPPPTLFVDGISNHSSLYTEVRTFYKVKKARTHKKQSATSSEDEREGGRGGQQNAFKSAKRRTLWVQCDTCHKWRKIPNQISTNKSWYCSMHPDSSLSSCAIPEERWKTFFHQNYIFSKLEAGQLVWAKMNGFSPWPAIISPDPWSDNEHISSVENGASIYHVEFLGKTRTHLWLAEEKVEPYNPCQSSLGSTSLKNKAFEYSVLEASQLISLTNTERLRTCVYTECFTEKCHQNDTIDKTLQTTLKKRSLRKKFPGAMDIGTLNALSSSVRSDLLEFLGITTSDATSSDVVLTELSSNTSETKIEKRKSAKDKVSIPDSLSPQKERSPLSENSSVENNQTQRTDGLKMKNQGPNSALAKKASSYKIDLTEAEEQAHKELEMIESMLSWVGEETTSAIKEKGLEEEGEEISIKVVRNIGLAQERKIGVDSKDEWVEDILGGINQLDGLIKELDEV